MSWVHSANSELSIHACRCFDCMQLGKSNGIFQEFNELHVPNVFSRLERTDGKYFLISRFQALRTMKVGISEALELRSRHGAAMGV